MVVRIQNKYVVLVLLFLPAILILISFFIVPLGLFLRIGFLKSTGLGQFANTFTLANFALIFTHSAYFGYLVETLKIAAYTTIFSLLLGYPMAYWIVHSPSKHLKHLVLIILIMLTMSSYVLYVFPTIIILGNYGPVDSILNAFGLGRLKLLDSDFAVTVDLVQWLMLYAVFVLSGSIKNIDPRYQEAAQNLGANPFVTFSRVTLPLSLPGIVAAASLIFSLSIAAFNAPILLGGGLVTTMPILVYGSILGTVDYPLGSAEAFVLLAIALIVSFIFNKLVSSRIKIS